DVVTASNVTDGLRLARAEPLPDLLLLDWMLPDGSGTEVCRQLRRDPATADIPIIMVTARAEEIDRVVGLEVGADDYVTKPFSTRELTLRVRALLRRVTAATPKRLEVDPEAHLAVLDGRSLELTTAEQRVLAYLIGAGRVVTREDIIDHAWERDATPASVRAVDSVIKRLRKRLGDSEACIEAVRGAGYRFNPDAL
ncbi:MAG: response regulator transcription factor, partial [Proteobacteria bacterium]|nr:response regulator transcription factor [Pseudomonadota bacterium]